jgi:hypothetical protein
VAQASWLGVGGPGSIANSSSVNVDGTNGVTIQSNAAAYLTAANTYTGEPEMTPATPSGPMA